MALEIMQILTVPSTRNFSDTFGANWASGKANNISVFLPHPLPSPFCLCVFHVWERKNRGGRKTAQVTFSASLILSWSPSGHPIFPSFALPIAIIAHHDFAKYISNFLLICSNSYGNWRGPLTLTLNFSRTPSIQNEGSLVRRHPGLFPTL